MRANIRDLQEISQEEIINNDDYYLLASDKYDAGKFKANYFITKQEVQQKHEELMERVNNIQINSFVVEWNKGKKRIVDAIRKFGINAEYTDSFDDLAEKIKRIPIKPEGETGIIDWTYNGAQDWDLLNELHRHQLREYPYCYGVLIDCYSDDIKLEGADAYYTSDGSFYTSSIIHHFVDNTITRYIIYYFKDKEYLVNFNLDVVIELICYNGIPKLIYNDTTKYLFKLESYTNEEYEVDENYLYMMKNPLGLIEIILNGITKGYNNAYLNNDQSYAKVYKLSLPKLKQWFGGYLTDGGTLRYVKLSKLERYGRNVQLFRRNSNIKKIVFPNLKELIPEGSLTGGSIVYADGSQTNMQIVNFPNLETIENMSLLGSGLGAIKEINLPKLKKFYNGSLITSSCPCNIENINIPNLEYFEGTFINGNTSITNLKWPKWLTHIDYGVPFYSLHNINELEIESLEKITRGCAISNFNNLKYIKFNNLKCIDSGGLINGTNNLLENIEIPELTTIDFNLTRYTETLISNAYKLNQLNFPKLKYWYQGNIVTGCRNLIEINFPELEYIKTSYTRVFGDGDIRANKININMPKLRDTNNGNLIILRYPYPYIDPELDEIGEVMYYEEGKPETYVIVNLGNPKEGYISFACEGNDRYGKSAYFFVKEIHIKSGFRSALHIGSFTELTHDNLLEILNNLEDNNEYTSKRITLGAINLAKLSDEEKQIATNKNYTLA